MPVGRHVGPCGSDSSESLQDVIDFWWIYAAVAVLIFVKLWSVLGQRTGRERPPHDSNTARDSVRPSTNDNVVALPGRAAEPPSKPVDSAPPPADRWSGVAEAGSAVAAGCVWFCRALAPLIAPMHQCFEGVVTELTCQAIPHAPV